MTSKAKRRSNRKISLAGGLAIEQRPTGRDRTHINKSEDALRTATQARQRHTGITDPKEALEALLSTDLGRCVHVLTHGDERQTLANAWGAISASRRNYKTRIIGSTGEPQCASIGMIPKPPTDADVSLRVDTRTADERDAGAIASWLAWQAKIAALPTPNHRWALCGALDGFMGEASLWRDRAPTDIGRVAVDALRMVAT